MAEIKTRRTSENVEDFINKVESEQKRKDSFVILNMMREATGEEPVMWGTSIIGFGTVKIKSAATGKEVEWLRMGFSPRKASLSLYLSWNLQKHAETLKKLGKHKTGVGCLYINKLQDIDLTVLKMLIEESLKVNNQGQV